MMMRLTMIPEGSMNFEKESGSVTLRCPHGMFVDFVWDEKEFLGKKRFTAFRGCVRCTAAYVTGVGLVVVADEEDGSRDEFSF